MENEKKIVPLILQLLDGHNSVVPVLHKNIRVVTPVDSSFQLRVSKGLAGREEANDGAHTVVHHEFAYSHRASRLLPPSLGATRLQKKSQRAVQAQRNAKDLCLEDADGNGEDPNFLGGDLLLLRWWVQIGVFAEERREFFCLV